jgi:uncharacterized membrane protein
MQIWGDALKRLKLFEEIFEILFIVKVCLTSFWFWVPILYAVYSIFQIWMLVYIHPLTILILPTALIFYLLILDKRKKTYVKGEHLTSTSLLLKERHVYSAYLKGEFERRQENDEKENDF